MTIEALRDAGPAVPAVLLGLGLLRLLFALRFRRSAMRAFAALERADKKGARRARKHRRPIGW